MFFFDIRASMHSMKHNITQANDKYKLPLTAYGIISMKTKVKFSEINKIK